MEWKAVDRRPEEIDRLKSLPELQDTHQRIHQDLEEKEKKDESDWPSNKIPLDRLDQCFLTKFLKPEKIIEEDEDLDLRSLTSMIEDQEESEGIKQEFIQEIKGILEKELFEKVLDEVKNMEKCILNLNNDIHVQQAL